MSFTAQLASAGTSRSDVPASPDPREPIQDVTRTAISLAKRAERHKAKIEAIKERKRALEFLTSWEGAFPDLRQHPAFEPVFDAIGDARDYFADGDK